VPGGFANEASGTNSFAAGSYAVASNTGTFVWSDLSSTNDFVSSGANQFLIRAAGGVGINTNVTGGNALLVNGNLRVTGKISSGTSSSATGSFAVVAGGSANAATNTAAAVVGGQSNSAGGVYSFVGGGSNNQVAASFATVGGGLGNTVDTNALGATIAGGQGNVATNFYGTVAGGFFNAAGDTASVGGGQQNNASGDYSTIPGGISNVASGYASFAAGARAEATHDYTFVWGGSPSVKTTSSTNGQYTVRAPGGVRFMTSTNNTAGQQLAAGGSSWGALSDSNAKTGVEPVDHRQTLAKLAALPVTQWRYKHDPSRHYIGPMAQDFHATFGLGEDNRYITTLDTDGVTLSAIKGLAEELQEQQALLATQEQQIQSLEKMVETLREHLEQGRSGSF